jgi:molybdopterin synthase catalytic subunit
MSNTFAFSDQAIDVDTLLATLDHPAAGGVVTFEGKVRNHNDGQAVVKLEYEAFAELASKEGQRVIDEALQKFAIISAVCVHRVGLLAIGDMAVWVGVAAAHRGAAFDACRYIIDELKQRVPIWKKEHYASGDSGWINCEAPRSPAHS